VSKPRALIASASLVRGIGGAAVLGTVAAAVGLMRRPSKTKGITTAKLPAE
jgi:hypothetical protein